MPALVSDRPTVTDWIASVQGTGLVEGRLELKLTSYGQFLASVLTDELVFSGDEQKVRIVLPPMNWPDSYDEILVDLRLRTKREVFALPQQRLRTSLRLARKFPLLMAESNQLRRTASRRDSLVDRLRFESLLAVSASGALGQDEVQKQVVTVISHLRAEEFPQDPLSFCQYEAVAIPGDVFPAFRSAQLEALQKWVQAGGSLYVEPGGVLETSHIDFLNRLAADDPRHLVFSTDSRGRLPMELHFGERIGLHFQSGLGTVVLHRDQAPLDEHENEWRQSAARLWKIRPNYVDQALGGAAANGSLYNAVASGGLRNGGYNEFGNQMSAAPLAEMVDLLKPPDMKLVPLWVITLLMSSLVLLIGPVDYFVLGALKRRKWTWITFPCIILAMTALTMLITNGYLSSSETRRAVVVHDVGLDGKIVRTNRFELTLASATRRMVSDAHGELFQPLFTGGVTNPRNFNPNYAMQMGSLSEAGAVEGRVPTRYKVYQEVRQWRPQLNRRFSIGPLAEAPAIDWASLDITPETTQSTLVGGEAQQLLPKIAQQLLPKVRTVFGPQANLMVLPVVGGAWTSEPHSTAVHSSRGRRDYEYQLSQRQQMQIQMQMQRQMQANQFPGQVARNHYPPQTEVLERLSLMYPSGAAPVMSSTSPRGGQTLDDLPVAVLGDYDRWWLVVMVPDGDDFVVYRKLYNYPKAESDDGAPRPAILSVPQPATQPRTPSLRVKQLSAPAKSP